MEREALPDVRLAEVPVLPRRSGTSTVNSSEEMLGRCTSMAAVVTTQMAASGTPLSAGTEHRGAENPVAGAQSESMCDTLYLQ